MKLERYDLQPADTVEIYQNFTWISKSFIYYFSSFQTFHQHIQEPTTYCNTNIDTYNKKNSRIYLKGKTELLSVFSEQDTTNWSRVRAGERGKGGVVVPHADPFYPPSIHVLSWGYGSFQYMNQFKKLQYLSADEASCYSETLRT